MHILGIQNPAKYSFCKILSTHFNEGACKNAHYFVQIIEKLEGSGKTSRGAMDPKVKPLRKARELHWMLKLRTVFPYGLNDRVGDEYKNENADKNIGTKFKSLERNFERIGRGKSKGSSVKLTPQTFISDLNNMLNANLLDTANWIRITLSSMKRAFLRQCHDLLTTELNNQPPDFNFSPWYLQCLDAIESKLYRPPIPKTKKSPPENICKIIFENKGIEMINLPRILRDNSLASCLPSISSKFPTPMICYKLNDTIGKKILNFNKFVATLDVTSFVNDPTIVPCSCENSPYRDPYHGHVITGNLAIIKNNKLRKIFTKGPKYREPRKIDFLKAKACILDGIETCAEKWCSKNALQTEIMKPWLDRVESLIDSRIDKLSETFKPCNYKEVLKDKTVLNDLRDLQDKYVIVPVDKAAGNLALICKRHYASVLVKELGLLDHSPSLTYTKIENSTPSDIVDKNIRDLNNLGFSDIPNENECLPKMYWIPKNHKTPIKERFIVASPVCSIKPLAKSLTSIFRVFFKQIEAYNAKCRFFSGVNTFWVIQNNKPVTESIKRLNARNKGTSISTFDFSTLYTKIPHDKLISVLYSIVDFCFNGGECDFLAVNDFGSKWVKDPSSYNQVFDKRRVKRAIKYLLDNCFFTVGNCLFQQQIGIPMGSDPAPFFANLFLYHYERQWLLKLKKEDLAKARKFGNTFRFIDDLCTLNDGGEFEKHYREIYPEEMQLSKENKGNKNASFLELGISIENKQIKVGLFDKRDAFPFTIVRMPYSSSNMPSTIFYSSLGAEILRIARATSNVESFTMSSKKLIIRMIKQGAVMFRVQLVLKKFFGRHQQDFLHVCNSGNDLCSLLCT